MAEQKAALMVVMMVAMTVDLTAALMAVARVEWLVELTAAPTAA